MPEFLDCLTDSAREAWAGLLISLGLYIVPKKGKPVEVSGKLETTEEIGKLIRQQPGRSNASSDIE